MINRPLVASTAIQTNNGLYSSTPPSKTFTLSPTRYIRNSQVPAAHKTKTEQFWREISSARQAQMKELWTALPDKSPMEEKKETDPKWKPHPQPFGACAEAPCDCVMIRGNPTTLTSVAFRPRVVNGLSTEILRTKLSDPSGLIYDPCANCKFLHQSMALPKYQTKFRHLK